jgi:hypothetical protein
LLRHGKRAMMAPKLNKFGEIQKLSFFAGETGRIYINLSNSD